MEEHIIIIGNGISGITCARHIRKNSNKRITVISGESPYFFSRTALMYVYMGHLKFEHTQPYEKWFWKKNKIELIHKYVTDINTNDNELTFEDKSTIRYDKLIIATGSKPNKFNWPGQNAKGVTGMYHKQDLDYIEKYAANSTDCKRAVIVGGGLIGVELAEMLHSRNIPVTFLVREPSFWSNVLPKEESEMINREIREHHIDLRLKTNLKQVNTDTSGKANSITIAETSEQIACNLVGLTTGVSPNINFIKNTNISTNKGILVNSFLETSVENIYAIGDCAELQNPTNNRKAIEAVWYTGRMMGETLAQTICGNKTAYKPGHWFNSAKFFNIEYQTYGWVSNQPKTHETHFYWEHETEKKCIRINYNKTTQEFIGINTLGIRMRHGFFEKMLNEKKSVQYVLAHLADANFDPEFYTLYEKEIVTKFNKENSCTIQLKKKSWKRIFS